MEYKSIIPQFSSNSSVDGFVLSASSTTNVNIFHAFDKNTSTLTRSSILPTVGEYIQVMFPIKFLVARYTITVGFQFNNGGDLKSWELQGLIDGTWKILHAGSHGAVVETLTFDFPPEYVSGIRIVYKERHATNSWGLSELEIFELVFSNKILVKHENKYKTYNQLTTAWEDVSETYPTEEQFLTKGINANAYLGNDISIVNELEGATILYYTDSDCSHIIKEDEVEPFSVYDYISETPTVVVYTESTDDIIVSTATEPYDLYEEFGSEMEVLYYTDKEAVTNANMVLEANWSPVDELEGDFEVVTWTDEPKDTAQRVLEMNAIPKPQFVKLVNPKRLYGYLDDVLAVDVSFSYRDEVRYLITDNSNTKWYVWDKTLKQFIEVDASTHELISKNGMKYGDLDALNTSDWRTWNKDYMNIGIFLKDNPRDTITSVVDSISYKDYLPRNTTTVEKANLYILNTTARIDIELNGGTLKGFLSDDDLTRVQYRVLLNDKSYYPASGDFTKLGDSPQNIELIINSKDIKIDDWNTIKVEFQDFFGTTDYWSTQFIGTYSGLMFKDVYGQYYSNEIGEVLQYLDFGVIIAGQTTLENEIILKNQYGYDVKNIHLYANKTNFPNGMTLEFSESQAPFLPQPELRLSKVLANNGEMSFFVRLKTTLGATPDSNGSFDIVVQADKV